MSLLGTATQLGIVVATVAGLWVGARLLVDSVVRMARRFGLSEFTIGLTVVAAGTSTPELAVTIDAAIKGFGDLALANVFGSNIYNIAFVLGVVSLVRPVSIAGSILRRDGVVLLVSTLAAGVVVADLAVTRVEGGILAGLFVAYTAFLLRTDRSTDGTDATPPTQDGGVVSEGASFRGRDVGALLVGLAVVLVSGDLLIQAASALARNAGVSEWVIGGTVVAAGTSTPELAVSLVALRQRSLGVSVGNVVGSNVFNLLGVVGVAALVRPLSVSVTALETYWWLVAISLVVVVALWTGRRLSRVEGALFAGSEVTRWVLGLFA
ncbi:Na+/Ca+ antiporter, CaCA family protein [Haloferax elongans ATCC BAA-1513]|uniref:Na+/Ca+ antiporter, CaCA family protein n=1 Tax=Haloferax elongans ATCC BAA-1513 TaxID=1230453 RepID=M0HWX0_HALEO|nr:sodium:calcium antiporter [Haloferax elongans]ELZ88228.1 Na+/Ca+ antiporter, CaCA family protein [Haloferax elongans ATCC BAA-1513]